MYAFLLTVFALIFSLAVFADEAKLTDGYTQTNFVANKKKYAPNFTLESKMVNAWGIAIRPKGAGGHFWVTAQDISYEYIGDVSSSSDPKLQKLAFDEKLKYVKLPVGGKDNFATGVVFSDSKDNFVITQTVEGVDQPLHAPSKFLFASDGGIISAWTERKHEDGSFDRAKMAIPMIDESKEGAQFFGLAISHNYDRLYAANFGKAGGIEVFNGEFRKADVTFDTPFDDNKNGKVDAGEYAPFNVQQLDTPSGEHHIFIAYAKTQACNKEGLEKHECEKDELYAGEEDTSKPGQGRLAEFDEDGKLVAVWKDGGHLSAPWAMVFAPANFGALSGKLLVGSFGDGSIAAFDPDSHEFLGVMKDAKGKAIKIEKIWGLLFGNGESLGDADALYFASGPNDEHDAIFGVLRLINN